MTLRDRNTITMVADHLALSPRTVRRLVDNGTLPCLRFGRAIRIKKDDVLALEMEGKDHFLFEGIEETVGPDTSPEFIYFVFSPRMRAIKIGYSRDVDGRIAALQTSAPDKLEVLAIIPGSMKDERGLHTLFAAQRLSGEWFEDRPNLRAHIAEVAGQ